MERNTKNWVELMENPWNSSGQIFPGSTTLGILLEIPNMMNEIRCEPETFTGRIIFMSMFNDIDWGNIRSEDACVS